MEQYPINHCKRFEKTMNKIFIIIIFLSLTGCVSQNKSTELMIYLSNQDFETILIKDDVSFYAVNLLNSSLSELKGNNQVEHFFEGKSYQEFIFKMEGDLDVKIETQNLNAIVGDKAYYLTPFEDRLEFSSDKNFDGPSSENMIFTKIKSNLLDCPLYINNNRNLLILVENERNKKLRFIAVDLLASVPVFEINFNKSI